jgi:hypothetical protein
LLPVARAHAGRRAVDTSHEVFKRIRRAELEQLLELEERALSQVGGASPCRFPPFRADAAAEFLGDRVSARGAARRHGLGAIPACSRSACSAAAPAARGEKGGRGRRSSGHSAQPLSAGESPRKRATLRV